MKYVSVQVYYFLRKLSRVKGSYVFFIEIHKFVLLLLAWKACFPGNTAIMDLLGAILLKVVRKNSSNIYVNKFVQLYYWTSEQYLFSSCKTIYVCKKTANHTDIVTITTRKTRVKKLFSHGIYIVSRLRCRYIPYSTECLIPSVSG